MSCRDKYLAVPHITEISPLLHPRRRSRRLPKPRHRQRKKAYPCERYNLEHHSSHAFGLIVDELERASLQPGPDESCRFMEPNHPFESIADWDVGTWPVHGETRSPAALWQNSSSWRHLCSARNAAIKSTFPPASVPPVELPSTHLLRHPPRLAINPWLRASPAHATTA
jgi:hypothetical protein